jgi:dynein heavy chain
VLVLQVCECVVILKDMKDVTWAGAKVMMTDPGFLKSLVDFDKDGLTDKQVKRVKTEYMKDPQFTHENLKNVSTAGAGTSALVLQATSCGAQQAGASAPLTFSRML